MSKRRTRRRDLFHEDVEHGAFRGVVWMLLVLNLTAGAVAAGQPELRSRAIPLLVVLILSVVLNGLCTCVLGFGRRSTAALTLLTIAMFYDLLVAPVTVIALTSTEMAAIAPLLVAEILSVSAGVCLSVMLMCGADVWFCSSGGGRHGAGEGTSGYAGGSSAVYAPLASSFYGADALETVTRRSTTPHQGGDESETERPVAAWAFGGSDIFK